MGDPILYKCPRCDDNVAVESHLCGDSVACPACGSKFVPEPPRAEPMQVETERANEDISEANVVDRTADDETIIHQVHQAMFRRNPFWFLLLSTVFVGCLVLSGVIWFWPADQGRWESATSLGLVLLLIALVFGAMLLVWWVRTRSMTLTVTNKRTRLREGILAKQTTEVQHDDVRNLQIDQSAVQRLLSVGDLAISSSGQDDLEVVAKGIPSPGEIAALIRKRQ